MRGRSPRKRSSMRSCHSSLTIMSPSPSKGDGDMIVSDEWQQRMLDLFRGDLPLISEMIRATESTIIGYPFYDIPTQPIWRKGRVVLVGDAIHAVSPSAGQGASLAVEDAAMLAKCLR